MKLNLILATDMKGGIGKDGKLPWKDKGEMKHFVETTIGHIVIMGYHTWVNDLKLKPLVSRTNIVIVKPYLTILVPKAENGYLSDDLKYLSKDKLNDYLNELNEDEEVFIIGGKATFEEYFDKVDTVYWSKGDFDAECDTFYIPDVENEKWSLEYTRKLSESNFTLYKYNRV